MQTPVHSTARVLARTIVDKYGKSLIAKAERTPEVHYAEQAVVKALLRGDRLRGVKLS